MSQKISCGTSRSTSTTSTESLIQEAFLHIEDKKITLNPSYLDDEKLTESERVAVLKEIFQRNIRQQQLHRLAKYLSPVLAGDSPANLLIYGPSGAGKSVTCLHFLNALASMCGVKQIQFQYYYVDLTTPKTCFGALNELALSLDGTTKRYRKGIALDQMQETVIQALTTRNDLVCIVVDEVDNVTSNSDLFYTFLAKTLPKRIPVRLFYLLLTNRIEWDKTLDPRILSVLKKTDIIFEPYDAMDLIEILNLRVEKALDTRKVDPAAIRKIAAYASRENGDARKAIELLVKGVKIAEDSSGYLGVREVDEADSLLEIDKTEQLIHALAPQQKCALLACYTGLQNSREKLWTGPAYDIYRSICEQRGVRTLTQRRFSDIVSFLDIYGLINARVISKGRYGKTRELSSSLPEKVVQKVFKTCGQNL